MKICGNKKIRTFREATGDIFGETAGETLFWIERESFPGVSKPTLEDPSSGSSLNVRCTVLFPLPPDRVSITAKPVQGFHDLVVQSNSLLETYSSDFKQLASQR